MFGNIWLVIVVIFLNALYFAADNGSQEGGDGVNEISKAEIASLRGALETLIKQREEDVAVSFLCLDSDCYLGVNDRLSIHAASTMKVPVMMEVFRQADEGKFSLNDSILIQNRFRSIVDSSYYALDVAEDGGERLYLMIGKKESIRSLVYDMITYSSNLATNLLIEQIGASNVQQFMESLGANDIRVLRGVEDIKAYRAGRNNTITAKDLALVFQSIYEGRYWNKSSRDEMLKILFDQTYRDKIPAGLPSNVKVAHKTGSITKIDHDSGIIFPVDRSPYVLVVLTRGFEEHEEAQQCIASISKLIYEWYMKE